MRFYKFDNIDRVAIKVSIYLILSVTAIYALSGIINWIPVCLAGVFNFILYVLGILKPLWVGIIIAYLLYPLVLWFNKHLFKEIIKRKKKKDESYEKELKREKTKKVISILFTYIFILFVIIMIFAIGFYMIMGSIGSNTNLDDFITATINYMDESKKFLVDNLQTRLDASNLLSPELKETIAQFGAGIGNFGQEALNFITSFLMELANNILAFLLGLVLAFYIMADLDFFKKIYKETQAIIMPRETAENINKFLLEVNNVISKFIRGQLLDCSIIAIISMISLSLIGLPISFVVGILIGIANVIPYFGAIIGGAIAVTVGLLTPDQPIKGLYALIVMLIIQQFDGNVMAPRIIGKSVGLHPLFILMAVIIGAQFGFIGLVLAVPTAGVIKLILIKLAGLRHVNVKE